MAARPTLFWYDLTRTTRNADVDPELNKHFEIRRCADPLDALPDNASETQVPVVFEFDYPDRAGLELLQSTKQRSPKTPILMLTTETSEDLAVWAYRNKVLDYFVKPLSADDAERILDIVTALKGADRRQNRRKIINFQSRVPREIPARHRTMDSKLAPAVQYVEKNFRGKIRNSDVADTCGMSACHFSHAFSKTFGWTFQEFVLRYRIYMSCAELRQPDISVSSVAYSVGFNDPSYFSRVFRRLLACSPTDYCDVVRSDRVPAVTIDAIRGLRLPEQQTEIVDPAAHSHIKGSAAYSSTIASKPP